MKIRMTAVIAIVAVSLLTSGYAGAAGIDDIAEHICDDKPIEWKAILDPEVLQHEQEFLDGTKEIKREFANLNKCRGYKIEKKSGGIDTLKFKYRDGTAALDVYFSSKGITGILMAGVVPKRDFFQRIANELKEYPGDVSAIVKRGDGEILFEYNKDKRLATGSSFKLYILKAILEDIKAGKRSWSDIVELDEKKFSLPSGILQEWYSDSPVTLHTLATLMISISDNTATDILIDEVGRGRLESMMPGSIPFLKTREFFIIKWADRGKLRRRYLRSNLKAKRRILKGTTSYNSSKLKVPPMEPIDPDKIEWFASSTELADLILSMKGEPVLAVNPGVIEDNKKWRYIGYNGGSEPGVIQYTQLLKSKSGEWYTISASWTNPEANVDEDRLASIVQRLANLI